MGNEMNDLLSSTEREGKEDDPVDPKGVGLKMSEHAVIEGIAEDLGVSPHAVRVYLMRWALKAYREGDIDFKIKQEPTLDMPE